MTLNYRGRISWLFLMFFGGLSLVTAQTGASLLSATYSQPAPLIVSPGQIVTLFFRGVGPQANGSLRADTATTVPWPATLAGISLHISQSGLTTPASVPILSLRQENECTSSGSIAPICLLTAVRIQIPLELAASDTPRLGPNGTAAPVAELVLDEDGKASRSFLLQPVTENGHVITSCDLAWDTRADTSCTRTAYHADGRPLSATAPGKLGETIVIFAYGLGQTSPPARTGQPSPQGASVLNTPQPRVLATFLDSFLNAPSSLPRAFDAAPYNLPFATIEFAGLSPNQIGVYQLNIPIPKSAQIPVLCGPDPITKQTASNALVQITTAQGTENVPICIAP